MLSDAEIAAMTKPEVGNPYLIAWAQLCAISYQDPGTIPGALTALKTHGLPAGSWRCVWGPVTADDDANLVYAASYVAPGEGGETLFSAVVIRGTDLQFKDIGGLLEQLKEDGDILHQDPWTHDPASSARVARGSMAGLTVVAGMQAQGVKLADAVRGLVAAPVVVTGHSLGGCLATVLAPWLKLGFPRATILPVTYAAPTAGDPVFAGSVFDATFPRALRCYNTLDVIPTGWAALRTIPGLYSPFGLPDALDRAMIAAAVDATVTAMNVAHVRYAQPANSLALPGAFVPGKDWAGEVLAQHGIATYVKLLGG